MCKHVGTEINAPLLHDGDLLVIHSIDRMGRNYTEIQEQWKYITHTLKANIRVLDMPLLDTSLSKDSLDSRFIADLTLQILSYVAEKERINIITRQKEGIASMPVINGKKVSSKTGKASGRPSAEFPSEWNAYYSELKHNIVITQKGMLVDGYCSYIVAVVCGIDTVECELNTKRLKHGIEKNRSISNRPHKRNILYHRQGGKCAICGEQLQIEDSTQADYLTFDYILPVCRGGSNGLMNLQGVCSRCNYQKQDKIIGGNEE